MSQKGMALNMKNNSILVIAAHPDDEVLGCGATIAKHCKLGDEVHVAILAEGLTSRSDHRKREDYLSELSVLADTANKSNKLLGVASVILHDFPDNRLDSVDRLDVIKIIGNLINQYRPAIVYTHHSGDLNIDHRIIHDAVVTACRPLPGNFVKTLLFFEVPSSTEWQTTNSAPYFNPNWFCDISNTLEMKLSALEVYQSEMREWPHPRSIKAVEHLAKWRGSIIGVEAAEAFLLGRHIR